MGSGPLLLMLHGAGGSSHSFRDMMTLLSADHTVIALDLPGQGFTQLGARHRSGLESTATDLARLCQMQGWAPRALVGHSAGGALALRLAEMLNPSYPCKVIGINAALSHFKGLAGVLFPAMAKALAMTPFSAELFSRSSSNASRVNSLIRSTGSTLTDEGLGYYRRLLADRDHVDGTLLMMAQWSLDRLNADLPQMTFPTLLISGQNDAAVPPDVARRAAGVLPNARFELLDGLGHLAHEEAPKIFARRVAVFAAEDITPPKSKGAQASA